MPQRNYGNEMLYENTYIKPKMTAMRMSMFPLTENNNMSPPFSEYTRPRPNVNMNNNHIKNIEPGLIRNYDNSPFITEISMREILGTHKKNCSSCRGG